MEAHQLAPLRDRRTPRRQIARQAHRDRRRVFKLFRSGALQPLIKIIQEQKIDDQVFSHQRFGFALGLAYLHYLTRGPRFLWSLITGYVSRWLHVNRIVRCDQCGARGNVDSRFGICWDCYVRNLNAIEQNK